MSEQHPSDDKDLPLRDDIRLLGRVLGDTVRAQEGEAVFDLVETIRQCSIRFRRHEDHAARRELEATLDSLSRDQTIDVVRAFSYFSHLSNIAEDQHHIRRSRAHQIAGSTPKEGSLAHALERAFEAGMGSGELAAFFETARVTPVLTAHPTEVQRKSILNCQMAIARLLDERDRMQLTPEERQANDEALRRAVLTLWQTRMLRTEKLSVMDEVSNGLSYFDYSFFQELPRLYARLEDRLASRDRSWGALELPNFMQVGSWIGGDRDGNPFVTAEILDKALATQAEKALTFYMDEVHTLGSQLSVAQGLVSASDALLRLAAASPDGSPHRSDEPYRRALTGIYARLAATYAQLLGHQPPRHAVAQSAPYAGPEALAEELEVIHRSLTANGLGSLARGRLRMLRRAVSVFGSARTKRGTPYYQKAEAMLKPLGRVPRALNISPRLAVQIRLDDGMVVELGRQQQKAPVRDRLERFVEYYPSVMSAAGRRPTVVDMRYPNGFALRVAVASVNENKGKP